VDLIIFVKYVKHCCRSAWMNPNALDYTVGFTVCGARVSITEI